MSWMGADQGCELPERRSVACTSLLESPAMTSRLSTQIAVGWGVGELHLFWTAHTFHSLRAFVELFLLPGAEPPQSTGLSSNVTPHHPLQSLSFKSFSPSSRV